MIVSTRGNTLENLIIECYIIC